MKSVAEDRLAEIAQRHGVSIQDTVPDDRATRLRLLREMLADQAVPFPVPAARAADCLASAERGDKFGVGALGDLTVDLGEFADLQNYEAYSPEEHLSWACLVADQQKTKHKFACREYLEGEATFRIGGSVIPDYWLLNTRIYQYTGWQLATVNKIIPAELFFTCHSRNFFPVTTFMRPLEQDYLEEPDIGHDVAGHVATFTIPAVAEVMRNHGLARDQVYAERDQRLAAANSPAERASIQAYADELLLYAGRIYWFTVEFGLVMQSGEVRDFGAGILSSPGETFFSIESPEPNRVLIDPGNDQDLLRLATTDYLISEFQKTYFVMSGFERLRLLTSGRIVAAARQAAYLPHYSWRELAPGDRVVSVGRNSMSPNEKYWRLMAGQPMDDCLTRAAWRNLLLNHRQKGFSEQLLGSWKAPMPKLPGPATDWFSAQSGAGLVPPIPVPHAPPLD